MRRRRFYRQNLNKRIDFICRSCKSKMTFTKHNGDIKIKCSGCGITFFIEIEVMSKYNNLVYWIPGK